MQWSQGKREKKDYQVHFWLPLLSCDSCNSQELSWTWPLGAEWSTPSGFRRSTCVSTRMAECVRAARLTLMLLYLALLDTASSIYPRIRLTYKGKKKKKKKSVLWVFYYLWLTNLGVITFFCCIVKPTYNKPTYCSRFSSIYDSIWGFLAQRNRIRTTLVSQLLSKQSTQAVGGDRRLYCSLWQRTQLVAFPDGEFFILPFSRLTTESQKH